MNKMTGMKIRYRFWVWALCLMFPTLVWAENAVRTCTSFYTARAPGDFSPGGQRCVAVAALQPFGSQGLVSPDGTLQRKNASFAVINEELEDVGTVHG